MGIDWTDNRRAVDLMRPQAVIVAYQRDGERLGPDEGMARIINPGDKLGARRVFNITHIQVLESPAAP